MNSSNRNSNRILRRNKYLRIRKKTKKNVTDNDQTIFNHSLPPEAMRKLSEIKTQKSDQVSITAISTETRHNVENFNSRLQIGIHRAIDKHSKQNIE